MLALKYAKNPAALTGTKFEGYDWRLEPPCDPQSDWLDELSGMRGRIIFDNGHRPAFQQANGSFADPDPVDASSFHVTARLRGKLIGCARLLKCANAHTNWTESFLGGERLEVMLNGLNSSTDVTAESGRWIVDPEHRGQTAGRYLMAGVYAVARWLGLRTILGWSGTQERQDRAFLSMGWKPVPGFTSFPAPQFDDALRLMYFEVLQMKRVQTELSGEMRHVLGLNERQGSFAS